MGTRELRQALLDEIDELEERVDTLQSQWDNHECETDDDLRAALEEANKERDDAVAECEKHETRSVEVGRELVAAKKECEQLRRDLDAYKKAEKCEFDAVAKLHAEVAELKKRLAVKPTQEQKVEMFLSTLGEKLAESYVKHESSQARWMMVAKDALDILHVRLS